MMLRNSKVLLCTELEAENNSKSNRRAVTTATPGKSCVTVPSTASNNSASAADNQQPQLHKNKPPKKVHSSKGGGMLKQFYDYLRHIAIITLTGAAALMACSLKGDLALVAIFAYKSYLASLNSVSSLSPDLNTSNDSVIVATELLGGDSYVPILPDYLQLPDRYNMKDLLFYIIVAVFSSQVMYQGVCGFLQLYFYTLKRDSPEEWKCQPHRFLTRSNEMHEIIVGTTNMTIAGTVSGILTCWIVNGNYSTVYFNISDYSYLYFIASFPIVFLWVEAMSFYSHALLHTPWLYKNCHKQHHRYHSPTAYSLIAMSPFELAFYDSLIMAPLFLFPVHGLVYVTVLVYVYYFGMMDHSGIKMTSWFPWQPDTMFHDDHHKYFHVNFGFNTSLFDRLHGTMRRPDREYGEDIFGGKGRERMNKK